MACLKLKLENYVNTFLYKPELVLPGILHVVEVLSHLVSPANPEPLPNCYAWKGSGYPPHRPSCRSIAAFLLHRNIITFAKLGTNE